VDRWVIDLASCIPDGKGIGMFRHLVQKDGARVLEQLDELNEISRTIQYHIVKSDLPFSIYTSAIQVEPKETDSSEVVWTSTIEPKGVDAAGIVKTLKTNYLRYLEALQKLCK
jgi:hypothetical protein